MPGNLAILRSQIEAACAERVSAPFAFRERKIVETAVDRVIWGTDWPHPNVKVMPNDGDLVDLIPLFVPEHEFQEKILVGNPARLFDFG